MLDLKKKKIVDNCIDRENTILHLKKKALLYINYILYFQSKDKSVEV